MVLATTDALLANNNFMACDKRKQLKCKEVFDNLDPDTYFTLANINELYQVLIYIDRDIYEGICSNLGMV